MPRKSPFGVKGTAVSFIRPDAKGRLTTAMVRARDSNGKYQTKCFAVTSWHRDGTPMIPMDAKEWVEGTRRKFDLGLAVAGACSFQEMAAAQAAISTSEGVSPGRVRLFHVIAEGFEREGITNMQSETFAVRVRQWLESRTLNSHFAADFPYRRKVDRPLSPATKNRHMGMIRQVVRLAVIRRRLSHDPLVEMKPFKTLKRLKSLFSVDELSRMVSDEARFHASTEQARIAASIEQQDGANRVEQIRNLAKATGVHPTTIYNRLNRADGADPWWLPCCLLVYTGCRAQEALHLRWEWIRWESRVISLKIHPDFDIKADQERLIPLEPELADILHPIAKPAGWIVEDENVRGGGSGMKRRRGEGRGARDYCAAFRRYLIRIGMETKDRTTHRLRHCFTTMKIARADMNLDRLRKGIGHADLKTTQGYSSQSQEYEGIVDKWQDSSLWLRRPDPRLAQQIAT